MNIYHEATDTSLGLILKEGLKCSDRGAKGQDDAIIKADEFLDECRPDTLKQAGVSRCNNVYGYVGTEGTVVSITDGNIAPLEQKREGDGAVLLLDINPAHCYVSDLDKFDAVKDALVSGDANTVERLASDYWQSLVPLTRYRWQQIQRPEVMITYDITPERISRV